MDYISQLYLPGALTLWCAMIFALSCLWGYALVLRGDTGSLVFARRSYGFFAVSIVLAAAILGLLLLMRDFRIEYVYQYSGMDLPAHYQLAAFWAGQKGSFLIWLLWGTLLGLLVRRTTREDEAAVMGVYTLTLVGLLFILVRENPFIMLRETPADGAGLNPLLQDDWMTIHPPIMFVGYAATAIPFSFAMASLWRRDYSGGWAKRAFPWALGGFLVLGAAILMGGYWAYKTLGWGGYWGWDPVENASLIPWIFGTTMIHGLYLERSKGRFRRVNYILATLTFLSVLYGTFLTRSGVLADFSVHSFVDLGISGWLIALMATFILMAAYLLATRLRHVPTAPNEDPMLSRGTFLVLSTISLAVAAVVITAGTSAPLLTGFMENPGQVGPEFYNRVNLPIALLIALLLSLVPYLTWKGTAPRDLARKLLWPGLFSLAATGVAVAFGVHDPFHVALVLLASLALASNFQKSLEKFRAAGFSLRGGGGYLAHVGVGVMLLGFMASSAYDQSAKVTLEQGKPEKIQDMTLTFTRFIPRQGEEKERMEIQVVKDDGERFNVYPRFFVNDRTRQTMVHPDIRTTVLADLYVSPIEFDPGQPRLELAKGESGTVGTMEVKFAGFDLNAGGTNAMAQMESGGPMTIGAMVEVTQAGRTTQLTPLYQMNPASGQVETPPVPLPGGGAVYVAGLNATNGAVQLEMLGISNPARLSVDVTKKPLINLVWYGLYIVLAGGAMAAIQRLREARILEKVASR